MSSAVTRTSSYAGACAFLHTSHLYLELEVTFSAVDALASTETFASLIAALSRAAASFAASQATRTGVDTMCKRIDMSKLIMP